MACAVRPISKADCPKGRAGLAYMYATACINVSDLTFDAQREVSAITMDAGQADPTFKKIEFDKNTAFLEQAKARVGNGNSLNVVQTISFNEAVMNAVVRLALEDLNDCCCVHIIAKDNTGRLHYLGISYNPDDDTWQSEDMKTGDGSGNTGADSTADSNEYIETLVSNTGYYAPFADDPANISTDCTNTECDEDAMIALNLDCWVSIGGVDDWVNL